MIRKLNTLLLAGAVAVASTPTLAHEPQAVAGGFAAWLVHQLTESDHIIAITVAMALGLAVFAKKKSAGRKPH